MSEEMVPIFYVKDGHKTAKWYARLGFEIEGEHRFTSTLPLYLFLRRGNVQLHLSEHKGDARPNTLVYFYVHDVDTIAAEFGVEVYQQPWAREVSLTDPDGNRLRIGERKEKSLKQSQKIVPCLWFDSNAEEAANFYVARFADSNIGRILRYGEEGKEITGKEPGTVMTVEFFLDDYRFVGVNGGPIFTMNPAISFFVNCTTEEEIDTLWEKLMDGGSVLMPLSQYPWSKKYGWGQDRFGVNWQLMLGTIGDSGQKIVPCLMYVGTQHGKTEEALKLYTELFNDAKIHIIERYQAGEGDTEGAVKHAQFALNGEMFVAMDSGLDHAFCFNEAISLQIMCETQAEIDHFWAKLTANGGEEQPCGWLKDKFGVSWQVTPTALHNMLHDPDTIKAQRATKAMFQMKKLDIDVLQRAYLGTA